MQYRTDKSGTSLSVLGYGCMRFSKKGARVDIQKTKEEIRLAIESGVNYFDTAYIYPGSEAALGEILEDLNCRDRVYITTKLPHYLIKNIEALDRIFAEQLSRLRTDHVDYYLMHMLPGMSSWEHLVSLGIKDWLSRKKASGEIRNVGFSFHGSSDAFISLVDAYDWDIAQIQYNYLDEGSQAGRRGLTYASEKGIPVVIMEPLRGGKLVEIPEKAKSLVKAAGYTPAELALKWLWDQPQVTVVLSGMNSADMVRENAQCAASSVPGVMTDGDRELIKKVTEIINEKTKVGCTGCSYCQPCPVGINIPGTFSAYNRRYTEGRFSSMKDYVMTSMSRNFVSAKACIKCGKCKTHCPQGIDIPTELEKAVKALEGPVSKVACGIMRKVMH